MRMKQLAMVGVVAVALAAGGYWYLTPASGAGEQPAAGGRPAGSDRGIPVMTAVAEQADVPVLETAIGRVVPLATVDLRSRVDSQIAAIHFTEGDEVKAGELLFSLDDRTAAASLRQAEANLAKDQAQLAQAKSDVERYEDLVKRNAVSRQQYDTAVATSAGLDAQVAADQAAVDQAKLTLSFTSINSPIDGRTGAVHVDPGNLVGAGNSGTSLVTITQLRPIAVAFTIPERYLGTIRNEITKSGAALPVSVKIPQDSGDAIAGKIGFVDSAVDTTTGTVTLKGFFDNADTRLWPGQFVNVTLTLGTDAGAILIPSQAPQVGQDGSFVFVVKPDGTAEQRPVTVSRVQDGKAVITAGLAADERVVVDGQLRLVPGAKVSERKADDATKQAKPQTEPVS